MLPVSPLSWRAAAPFHAKTSGCCRLYPAAEPGCARRLLANRQHVRNRTRPTRSLTDVLLDGKAEPSSDHPRERPGSWAEAPELEAGLPPKLSTHPAPGNTQEEKLFPMLPPPENPLPNTTLLWRQSQPKDTDPYETTFDPPPSTGADLNLSSSSYRKTL